MRFRRPRLRSALRHTASALAFLLACLAAGTAAAQQAPEIFVDVVEVDVVNVEVVVTDEDGNPVRGLERDDFVVKEDGQPVELTNFYAVEAGQRRVPDGEAEAIGETAPLPSDQRLHLVVLVDNFNIDPGARARVLEALRPQLHGLLRPGDRVLVASLGPELRIEQPLTEDVAAATAAIERVARSSSGQGQLRILRQQLSNSLGRELTPGGSLVTRDLPEDAASRSLDRIRAWAEQMHSANGRLMKVMEDFVGALAGLPGRRAVLYVSQGFDPRPAEPILEEWFFEFPDVASQFISSPTQEANRWDSSRDLRQLARLAAGSRVTFYALDAGGSSRRGSSIENRNVAALNNMGDITADAGLLELAARTGGAALLNSANVSVLLDRLSSDFREYYSLGFTSPRSGDGEYHRIEVEVPGRRLEVRHTEGYRARGAEERMNDRTLTALVFDVADNPLRVRVELGKEQPEKRGQFILPVLVRVPISTLTLLPSDKVHRGRVSIYIAAQDERGRLSAPQRVEVPVEIPNERLLQAMTQEVGHGVNLLVRSGESKLAVGVRDELAAIESTLNLNLTVGGG